MSDLEDDDTGAEEFAPLPCAHPGVVLRRDFLEPLDLSANALAMAMRIPAPRVSELVRGRRGVTPDTALRLGQALGTPAEFWLALQAAHDLAGAREADAARINAEVAPVAPADKPARKATAKLVKRLTAGFRQALTEKGVEKVGDAQGAS